MTSSLLPDMRRAVAALVAVSISVSGAQLGAQPTTLNFNTLTESSPGAGIRFVNNCYQENGFTLIAVGVSCTGPAAENAFLANSVNSPAFGGNSTASLILETPDAELIDLKRVDGGNFALTGIGLSGFFEANMTEVMFTGFGSGTSIMQTFTVGATYQDFMFNGQFTNLTSVRITAMNEFDEPLVNFDNIMLIRQGPGALVPEPSSLALMFGGLALMAAASRRRRHA